MYTYIEQIADQVDEILSLRHQLQAAVDEVRKLRSNSSMENINVKIKKLRPDAKVPFLGSSGSAGWDVFALDSYYILPGRVYYVSAGFALEMPDNVYCHILGRSSIHRSGLMVFPGTIDSDYRGELGALVYNVGNEGYYLTAGDRFAQLLFHNRNSQRVNMSEVDELTETDRNTGGFGSTGK